MVSQWEVLERLRQTVTLDDDEAAAALPFCKAAAQSFERKLRKKEDCANQLIIMLCAMTALYKFLLARSAADTEFTGFRAGDVTVKKSYKEALEAAEKLKDDAFEQAAHLLKDDEFVFRRF